MSSSSLTTLWSGTVLVSGLSDSHSEKWARMRTILSANGVLWGGHDSPTSTQVTLVPRLLLLGVTIEQSTAHGAIEDELCVKGAPNLSRDVFLRPCGESEMRASFSTALRAAAAGSPTLMSGLALVSLSSSAPRTRTPCILTLTSNKHRVILRLEPVRVVGLVNQEEVVGVSASGSAAFGNSENNNNNDTDNDNDSSTASTGTDTDTDTGTGTSSDADIPTNDETSSSRLAVWAKVVAPTTPNDGSGDPIYLKIAGDGVAVGEQSEGVTVAVRCIARTRLLGLINYKRTGTAQTLSARALELFARDVALLAPTSPKTTPSPSPSSAPLQQQRTWGSLFGFAAPTTATAAQVEVSESELPPPRHIRVLSVEDFANGFDELALFLRQLKATPAIAAGPLIRNESAAPPQLPLQSDAAGVGAAAATVGDVSLFAATAAAIVAAGDETIIAAEKNLPPSPSSGSDEEQELEDDVTPKVTVAVAVARPEEE